MSRERSKRLRHSSRYQSDSPVWQAPNRRIKVEGWILVGDLYDDGGFSGGTTERPALQRLLRDVESGVVDVVVVYNVDRLSRSLADFARIVEVFDKNNASFVSITQRFNTTTSMGRLTLNILLSFAQFEREVRFTLRAFQFSLGDLV